MEGRFGVEGRRHFLGYLALHKDEFGGWGGRLMCASTERWVVPIRWSGILMGFAVTPRVES